jgi:Na+-transporting methylmalonyl-CoA/oxaloacetate decarboxylase gamma subunit
MILQALQVMLYGMVGIFIVMGIIILAITLLGKSNKGNGQ